MFDFKIQAKKARNAKKAKLKKGRKCIFYLKNGKKMGKKMEKKLKKK